MRVVATWRNIELNAVGGLKADQQRGHENGGRKFVHDLLTSSTSQGGRADNQIREMASFLLNGLR
jgi:hypothetical protein